MQAPNRTSYKRSFVSKMHQKMEQANILFHQWDDIDRVFCNTSKFTKNLGATHRHRKKWKTDWLNQTEPVRISSVITSHGNTYDCNGNTDHSISRHGNTDHSISRHRDISNISRLNVTISLPVFHLSILNQVCYQSIEHEIQTYVARKEHHQEVQTANKIRIMSSTLESTFQSETSDNESKTEVSMRHEVLRRNNNDKVHRTNTLSGDRCRDPSGSPNNVSNGSMDTRYYSANSCTCTRNSDLLKLCCRTTSDTSTDSAYTMNSSQETDHLSASGIHPNPTITLTMDLTSFNSNSISKTSDLTDSVSSNSTAITGSPKNSTFIHANSYSVNFPNSFNASHIPKNSASSACCSNSSRTSNGSSCRVVNNTKVRARDLIDTLSSLENGENSHQLLVDTALQPLLTSMLTPHQITENELTPPAETVGSGSVTASSDPSSREQPRVNSINCFHNIIKSIDELEKKMGPESHEDLQFLRSILENNRLSALHRVLQTVAQKTYSMQTSGAAEPEVTNNQKTDDVRPHSQLATSLCVWEEVPNRSGSENDEDEDLVTIKFNKVRGALGATIVEDRRSGAIIIKRVLEDSPLAACNKVHPGDQLKLVNSVPVKGRSLEEVCDMLTQPTPDITLTVSTFGVVPEDLASFIAPKSRFFRAYFNYDPKKDPANPCQEASFSFELGDILEVVSTQDESWWHARKYGTPAGGSSVGLIPTAHQRLKHLSSRAGGAVCSENLGPRAPRRKLKKKKEMKVPLAERDPREPLTYLEVTLVKPSKKKRRPVIVTGAKGYGGPCIRKLLLHNHPEKYLLPRKHTTKSDIEGYKVCSKKEFLSMIKHKEFFEYSKVGSYYFGTAYESVRDLVVLGKVCLLDVHPQYLPLLCNGTLRPHVIFMESSTEERMRELRQTNPAELPQYQRKLHGSEIRELRFNSERLLRRYTEFVDTIITVESLTSAADLIDQVTDRIIQHPSWMPRKWVESCQ